MVYLARVVLHVLVVCTVGLRLSALMLAHATNDKL